ncbi:Membrane-associated kinase regulator 5 [Euphorbia peplus]|nr:Membrane-associated kinase regulator 5 [Euphorbia peplus]
MESFSLLKYWKSAAAAAGGGSGGGVFTSRATTIFTSVPQPIVTDEDDDNDNDDDGPFFDLEFSVPDDEEAGEDVEDTKEENDGGFEEENDVVESDDDGECTGEREFKFTLSSGSSNDREDENLPVSPSDDLFFKGRLVPVEPDSVIINGGDANLKQQLTVPFMKSATKLRVLMLKLKKSATEKPVTVEKTEQADGSTDVKQNKFFTVKFKVEEMAKVSRFTRDNSRAAQKFSAAEETVSSAAVSDDKLFSKDVMQKYLKKVKPLYVRVSKRYGDKLRFSGQLSLASGVKPAAATAAVVTETSPPPKVASNTETDVAEAPVKSVKQGNIPAGLRVVCKHLGKSRSASSAVAAAPVERRDDSLLLQQDGIQSAILHCKRSFNASRDLSRSVSDPSHEKTLELTRKSAEEGKVEN